MDRIRQLRKERGLSQAKLAVRADMDPATLNRLEQGKGNPNLRTLERVAEALDVEVADLLGKVQAPPSQATLFDGFSGEGRRARYLRTIELFATAMNEQWAGRVERDDFSEEDFEREAHVRSDFETAYVMGLGTDLLAALRTRELTLPDAEREAFDGAKASLDMWHSTMWRAYDRLQARGAPNVLHLEDYLKRREALSAEDAASG